MEQESERMTSVDELLDEYYGDVKKPNKIFRALYAAAVFYVMIGLPILVAQVLYLYVKTISALVR